ncbi:hypothetical protein AALP_AA8G115000 [Arabis alpina]|uniref:Uncharacterized protein n=1 Tax=Arabis alpina TaxID=50452 RepID=A0A087G6D4_ARAAL|nr:hypothetical protein AALP_AA8G115000 [Arabis alpina]
MQSPICNPNPKNHLEFLKPLLNDSIKQFLLQYRNGRTHFSDFDSIFTRILHDLPNPPPLELLWFYSAIRFHSSKLDFQNDSLRLTSSFFQLLVSLSDSLSGVKRIALLSPVVYQLSRLVNTRKIDALSLLDGILSYISMYCCDYESGDEVLMVSGFCFSDLIRVWVVDEADEDCSVEDCLEIFMPFVSGRLSKEMDSELCSVGYLAGIVASQVFLLSLCLRFDSELSRSDSEVEKDLRESVIQMISGFQSCYFFDVILKMLLLEPNLHLTSLLGPEDEATLTEIIREAVMEAVEKLYLNPGNGTLQRSIHLKNIAINWLFLLDNAMAASLRRNKDQEEETSRYMNMYSNSRIPYHLINWVISQGEVIRDADTLLDLTPASFIEWLVTLEEQGIKVFNCDHSKNYAKTVIHRSRADFCLEAKQQEDFDQDADMADDQIVSSISIFRSSGTRKRKEARHNKGGETKVKLFKRIHGNVQDNSKFRPFAFSDSLVNGTEVEVSDMEL